VGALQSKRFYVDHLLHFLNCHRALSYGLTYLADDSLKEFCFEVQEILVAPCRAVAGNDYVCIKLGQRPQTLGVLAQRRSEVGNGIEITTPVISIFSFGR
jgi:hypothetical protein